MDRVILLALLGIPVLVVVHVALSLQNLAPGVSLFSEQERPYLHGHWQPLEASMPSRFVTPRGS
jgi:hypothetical protein